MDYYPNHVYEAERETETRGDLKPFDDMVCYLRTYAKEQPEMAALACLGIGFILGWKLKPW